MQNFMEEIIKNRGRSTTSGSVLDGESQAQRPSELGNLTKKLVNRKQAMLVITLFDLSLAVGSLSNRVPTASIRRT